MKLKPSSQQKWTGSVLFISFNTWEMAFSATVLRAAKYFQEIHAYQQK